MHLDPVFSNFRHWSGAVPAGYVVEWNGSRTRATYGNWASLDHDVPDYTPPLPNPETEEFLEWVTLLTAAVEACENKLPFTFIELGAGWGRWLVNAARAANDLGIDYRLIGVEAEPEHFRWMRDHVVENGVDLDKTTLLEAAVARRNGKVRFQVGNATGWYGQSIATEHYDGVEVKSRPAISLSTILNDLDYVDLIDFDIQGSEFDVLWAARKVLNQKVRRLYISTHKIEIEHKLRAMLIPLGWYAEHDYSLQGRRATIYGPISFGDGVQAWRNMQMDKGGSYG